MRLQPTLVSMVFVGCVSVWAQNVGIDNTAKYLGNGRYNWTVFATGDAKALSEVGAVQYTLHPTFSNPVVWGSGPTFAFSAVGWGEFNLVAKIYYKDKRRPPTTINHWLHLFSNSKAPPQRQEQ
jgi:transcription initiation factor IIF auxiliary subunit